MDAQGFSIAVVIPTHDRAHLVGRAIESVLAQSRLPDEIVVVDDGSTDDTASIVRRYGPRVHLVRRARGGVASARNAGASVAEADFVAFLDSDDYWDDSHLDAVSRAIAGAAGGADLYFTDLHLSDARGGGTIWERCGFSIAGPYELADDPLPWLLLPRQPMMIQGSVIRRSAYLLLGGSEEHLVRRSDTHLIFKVGLSGAVCAVDAVTGHVTSDDRRSLTFSLPDDDRVYLECTVWLYEDVRARMRERSRRQRSIVASRLADAHWKLARSASVGPIETAAHVAGAVRRSPGIVPRRALSLASRRLSPGTRDGHRQPPADP